MDSKGIDTSRLKRPAKTWKILKKAFIGKNCMDCGICCSTPEGAHRIAVIGNDPVNGRILAAARGLNLAIEHAPNGGFDIVSGNTCDALEDSGGRKGCRIYRIRPMICAIFPFLLVPAQSLDDAGTMRVVVALTSKCPPVKELSEHGVEYVSSADIEDSNLPIISQSYLSMVECMAARIPIFHHSALFRDGNFIFPVL